MVNKNLVAFESWKSWAAWFGDIRGFGFGGFEVLCHTRQWTSSWQLVVLSKSLGFLKPFFSICQTNPRSLRDVFVSKFQSNLYTRVLYVQGPSCYGCRCRFFCVKKRYGWPPDTPVVPWKILCNFSRFSIDNDTSVVLRVIRVTKLFRDLAKKSGESWEQRRACD